MVCCKKKSYFTFFAWETRICLQNWFHSFTILQSTKYQNDVVPPLCFHLTYNCIKKCNYYAGSRGVENWSHWWKFSKNVSLFIFHSMRNCRSCEGFSNTVLASDFFTLILLSVAPWCLVEGLCVNNFLVSCRARFGFQIKKNRAAVFTVKGLSLAGP